MLIWAIRLNTFKKGESMAISVYTDAASLELIDGVTTPFATGKIKLVKTDFAPDRFTTIADLVQADFSGYAAKTLTAVGTPYTDPIGGADMPIPSQEWAPTGDPPAIGNDIYGFWIEDAAGVLLLLVRFDNPVVMQVHGNALVLLVICNYFGAGVVQVIVNGTPA